MYNPRMLLPLNKDIPLLLAFTCLSQTQAISKMALRRDFAQLINESIAETTFGRVFRLQGCGVRIGQRPFHKRAEVVGLKKVELPEKFFNVELQLRCDRAG